MADRARLLLDELMGKDRDMNKKIKLEENMNESCIYNSISFCPFKIFENTKLNTPKCKYKNHRLVEYNESDEKEYMDVLLEFFIKIKLRSYYNNQRLKDSSNLPTNIVKLINEYDNYVCSIEKLGEINVLQAFESLMTAQRTLSEIDKQIHCQNINGGTFGMKVCDCGSIISKYTINEDIHLRGRFHKGYVMVMEKLIELLEKYGIFETM